jgi:3-phosphoshikimate 1-carboxyvinyltransferase
MPLPACIEIVPPAAAFRSDLTLPGSKSITNRALVLAALAQGRVILEGALWSEDSRVMVEALGRLGLEIGVGTDPAEEGNRQLTVQGGGGQLLPGGSEDRPVELFVGNAGTAARFVSALVCLGRGCYRLDGVPRMRERPQAELFSALRSLGYRIDSQGDRLPAVFHGAGPRSASCTVSLRESSQFASALLLVASHAGWTIEVEGWDAEEAPYVAMTRELVRTFPGQGGRLNIEPDASSGSYFWAAAQLLKRPLGPGAQVTVAGWPTSGWQVDQRFPEYWPLPPVVSRLKDLGDSIMTAVVMAPFAAYPVTFSDLGRLRVQECERVRALRTELTRCGARVDEMGDNLTVYPGPLHGAEIETYNDHRVAMCFATLGLHVPGVRIKNPSCVAKTFPNFFCKLAAPPPAGLGVVILDGRTGRPVAEADLGFG